MLGWRKLLSIAALVAYVLLLWWWASSGYPTEAQICEPSGNTENCTSHNILFALTWDFAKKLDHWSALITAIATGFIAAFTYTLWKATIGTLKATQDSIDLARKEFLATHRPKVRIKNVWLMSDIWHDEPIIVRVVCVNNGTTDATMVSYAAEFFVVKEGRSLPPDHQLTLKCTQFTLPSGKVWPLPDFTPTVTDTEHADIRNGKAKWYCLGFLHYIDGVGRSRSTGFCRVLTVPKPGLSYQGGTFTRTDNADYEYED